ncbi:hypothetical protein [Aquimarina algiphila]|uniref:DNA-binding protein n=1 Tax=Aquimarina algiphila TaxID=2047982 RepID=A0A554VBE0_9FLAO|nr:hypothetical protein [Aquimarina algiphila]TSE03811.1 hypothetical protein FOF46_28485 [Aquimarina algiphila]
MNLIIRHVEIMERIDQLIRLQATGSPEDCSARLGISKTKLYRIIGVMKNLNAPIEYDFSIQSYVYVEEVGFKFGFYTKKNEVKKLNPFVG